MLATAGAGHAASTVVSWGYGGSGLTPIPSGLTNVVAIATGGYHSLALTATGNVLAWGSDYHGRTNVPMGLSNVVTIAAGSQHSLALTADRRVVGWGDNRYGQATIPNAPSNVVAIAAGEFHSLALTSDGLMVASGDTSFGQTTIPCWLTGVVAIAAGGYCSLALTAEGRVVGWGLTDTIPTGLSNIVAIAGGFEHSLAIRADGRVAAWGLNDQGQADIPVGLSNVVAIAAGEYHSLALTAEGRVVGWGANNYGQTNVPSGLSNVVAVSARGYSSLALQSDEPPKVTGQPVGQSVMAGGLASFAVQAINPGTVPGSWQWPPLRYRWFKGGAELVGQTNAGLHLDGVSVNTAGSYAAVVSSFAGYSTTSSVAVLTVACLLNASATAGGSVSRDPDLISYPANSSATVTATPGTGFGFIRWTGDASGNTNPLTVTLDTNKNITAVFTATTLTLSSQGVGTITKAPDQPFYAMGEQVTLNATAGRWHVFTGWADGNANNPRTVTIGESNAYTAVFTPTTPLETVTIGGVSRLAPVGMPAVVVDGMFITADTVSARGSALVTLGTTFPFGTLLYTLDGTEPTFASAAYGGPFRVGKSSVLRVMAYNADFTQSVAGDPLSILILPTLTGLTDGGGNVAIEPPAGDYFSNSMAVVTATPELGWTFLQWLGDAAGTNPVATLRMTRNKAVRAVFGTALGTAVIGNGSVVVSPLSSHYPYGSQVRLTPVPVSGNYFSLWANAAAGRTNNPLSFTVTNANPTVMAVFTSLGGPLTNALTVIPDGRGRVTLKPAWNRFPLNTNAVLQAIAEPGQEFIGWSGAASGSQNPLTVTMNSNKVITASFTKRPWLHGEGNPDLLRQDGFRLTLTGEFGAVYQLFGSPDLSDWTALGTVSNAWGTVQFTDPAGTNQPWRFYRALLKP